MSYAPALLRVPVDQRRAVGTYLSRHRSRLHAGKPAGLLAVITDDTAALVDALDRSVAST